MFFPLKCQWYRQKLKRKNDDRCHTNNNLCVIKEATYNSQVIAVLIMCVVLEGCFFILFSNNIKRIRLT